jgi:2-methylisocitrate lyase-like PEP mutase family enzyme
MTHMSTFRALHLNREQPLILPNAWDAGSARIVESLGASAVATTSAGVAWALGYPDGNRMPIDTLASLAARIVRAVRVPVSIDVEAGYSDDPTTTAANVMAVVRDGVAGINIEDGKDAPAVLARKIEAIKRAAAAAGLDLFINARSDVYLQNLVPDDKKVQETLARAATYAAAGADGLFVPALTDPSAIEKVTSGTALPVNLLAWPGLGSASELARLGVRRLSAGSGFSQMLWQQFAALARSFLSDGNSELFAKDSASYGELQGLFSSIESAGDRRPT